MLKAAPHPRSQKVRRSQLTSVIRRLLQTELFASRRPLQQSLLGSRCSLLHPEPVSAAPCRLPPRRRAAAAQLTSAQLTPALRTPASFLQVMAKLQLTAAMSAKTYLITGASRGVGLELCKQLAARPDTRVVAAARRPEQAAELQVNVLVELWQWWAALIRPRVILGSASNCAAGRHKGARTDRAACLCISALLHEHAYVHTAGAGTAGRLQPSGGGPAGHCLCSLHPNLCGRLEADAGAH